MMIIIILLCNFWKKKKRKSYYLFLFGIQKKKHSTVFHSLIEVYKLLSLVLSETKYEFHRKQKQKKIKKNKLF